MTEPRSDESARIVDAAFEIISEQGWQAVTLDAVAARCGVARDEVYRLTPSPSAMLDLFARRIDLAVAADSAPPPEGETAETPRDRLFDVLMRRFDALAPYRDALVRLARDLPRDPPALAATLPQAGRSFAFILGEAGISADGLTGHARIAALLCLWLAVQRTWLQDDSEDAARTMAALDRHLVRLFDWSPCYRNI